MSDSGRDLVPSSQPPAELTGLGSDPSGLGDSFDLDVAAASLRADSQDVGVLLKLLARQLADALGDRLVVERKGGVFKKSDEIKSLRMTMNDETFEANREGTALVCTIGKTSGGIRIRSEKVGADEWLRRTLVALQAEARTNSVARQALEHIVIGGP